MIREIGVGESGLVFDAMAALRPALDDPDEFAEIVDGIQRAQGYRLVGVFEDDDPDTAAAVTGFRTGNNLAWGYYLYVDDLSTLPAKRGRGYARALVDWLVAEAKRLHTDQLHLDSGVGPQRYDAHRLYLNARLTIASHHFVHTLD